MLASVWLGKETGNQLVVKQRWQLKDILGRIMARIVALGRHVPFPNSVITAAITEHFLCSRHFSKHHLPFTSINPPNNQMGWILLSTCHSEETENQATYFPHYHTSHKWQNQNLKPDQDKLTLMPLSHIVLYWTVQTFPSYTFHAL